MLPQANHQTLKRKHEEIADSEDENDFDWVQDDALALEDPAIEDPGEEEEDSRDVH